MVRFHPCLYLKLRGPKNNESPTVNKEEVFVLETSIGEPFGIVDFLNGWAAISASISRGYFS
jgi:hypothetical protein